MGGIYVDKGNPYKQGLLKVGQITLSETIVGSPLHTIGNNTVIEMFFYLFRVDF